MIPQQSGKIKFCVMKFANIFLMGKLNPQNFFYTFKIEVQLFRPLPHLRSVAEKAREGTKCDRVYRQYKK